VLFLDLAGYSKKTVAEQLQLKQALGDGLARALEPVAQRDRIILDTGDGAAVTFLGDPEDALFAALSLRAAASRLQARMGINLGPVRLVKDINGRVNIIGDGINVAQRVMAFAAPGQLLVSRSFYEVVSCLSRDYAGLFRHEGARTDKHVREHELYSVGAGAAALARRLEETSQRTRPGAAARWLAATGPLGLRRSALLAAPLAFALIVGGGFAVRAATERPAAPETAPAPPASMPLVVPKPVAAPKPLPPAPVAAATGRIQVAVAPWGVVFVDGRKVGVSPPLRVVEVAPGEHMVEIRNTTFPPYVERVTVAEGQPARVRHRFR
jgi:hypothetical protein